MKSGAGRVGICQKPFALCRLSPCPHSRCPGPGCVPCRVCRGGGCSGARGEGQRVAGKGSEIAQAPGGVEQWVLVQPGPSPFRAPHLQGCSRRKWGELRGAGSRGRGWACGGLRASFPLPPLPRWRGQSPEPGFLPGKPAGGCFTHSDSSRPSWFSTPSGRCLLEARRLEGGGEACRGLEERRRRRRKAASPSPRSPCSAGL